MAKKKKKKCKTVFFPPQVVSLFCAKCGKSGTKVTGTEHVKLPLN